MNIGAQAVDPETDECDPETDKDDADENELPPCHDSLGLHRENAAARWETKKQLRVLKARDATPQSRDIDETLVLKTLFKA